jgi:hypothetical protein
MPCLQTLFFCVVSILVYGFTLSGNKDLHSLLAEVLWGLLEPYFYLPNNLINISKLPSTNEMFQWKVSGSDPSPGCMVDGATCSSTVL